MLPEEHKRRDVFRQPGFDQDLLRLGFDAVRADEFTEGAEWILSRYPDFGTKLAQNLNVWFLPIGRPSQGLSLYYTYDEDRVYFLSLQRASEEVD
jgi:hypothetical protein